MILVKNKIIMTNVDMANVTYVKSINDQCYYGKRVAKVLNWALEKRWYFPQSWNGSLREQWSLISLYCSLFCCRKAEQRML